LKEKKKKRDEEKERRKWKRERSLKARPGNIRTHPAYKEEKPKLHSCRATLIYGTRDGKTIKEHGESEGKVGSCKNCQQRDCESRNT